MYPDNLKPFKGGGEEMVGFCIILSKGLDRMEKKGQFFFAMTCQFLPLALLPLQIHKSTHKHALLQASALWALFAHTLCADQNLSQSACMTRTCSLCRI